VATSDQTDPDCPLGPSYRYGLEERARQSLILEGAAHPRCDQGVLAQVSFHKSLRGVQWICRNDQAPSKNKLHLESPQGNLH
jgi:hypothetical protein